MNTLTALCMNKQAFPAPVSVHLTLNTSLGAKLYGSSLANKRHFLLRTLLICVRVCAHKCALYRCDFLMWSSRWKCFSMADSCHVCFPNEWEVYWRKISPNEVTVYWILSCALNSCKILFHVFARWLCLFYTTKSTTFITAAYTPQSNKKSGIKQSPKWVKNNTKHLTA